MPSTDTRCILQLSFSKIFPFFQCLFPPKNWTIALSFELNERISFTSWDFFLTINLGGLIKSILVEMFVPIKSCAGINEIVVWVVDLIWHQKVIYFFVNQFFNLFFYSYCLFYCLNVSFHLSIRIFVVNCCAYVIYSGFFYKWFKLGRSELYSIVWY